MTEALTLPGVRVLPSEIGPVMPVVDIIELMGYSRSGINKAIKDYKEKISPCETFLTLPTSGGPQRFQCFNRLGMNYLFAIIHPSKAKIPLDELLEFRKGILEKLDGARELAPQDQKRDLLSSVEYHGKVSKALIDEYGYEPATARKLAMEAVVLEVGDEARIYRGPAVLPALPEHTDDPIPATGFPEADPDFEVTFSMKRITEMCQCTRDEAVNVLDREGIIKHSNGIWHLTRLGERYGKAFTTYPLAPHRMTEKRVIRYWPVAVNLIRGRLSSTQAALPARAEG